MGKSLIQRKWVPPQEKGKDRETWETPSCLGQSGWHRHLFRGNISWVKQISVTHQISLTLQSPDAFSLLNFGALKCRFKQGNECCQAQKSLFLHATHSCNCFFLRWTNHMSYTNNSPEHLPQSSAVTDSCCCKGNQAAKQGSSWEWRAIFFLLSLI